MTILVVFALFFLKVWPIHFYFIRVIMISFSSFSFINSNSWWSLYFTSVCTWERRPLVRRQVSDPYRSTDLTLGLNVMDF